MSLWSPDLYQTAWRFAAEAHQGQKFPGSELPYIVHVSSVAAELCHAVAARAELGQPVEAPDLAVACALLHDVVEDTEVSAAQIAAEFGDRIAAGVLALSKKPEVGDKPAQMADSLARIRLLRPEVWMVKLGDRITNLQAPPHYWKREKIAAYREEARLIHAQLGTACPVLAARLLEKISDYGRFLELR